MKPTVDILVRTFNSENTIRRCLDSLVNQTYEHVKIFVSDDNSQDKTVDIIRNEYPSVILSVNKKKIGPSLNRKRLVDIATDDYISFVDSDDWIDNEYIEVLVEKMVKNKVDVIKSARTVHTVSGIKKYDKDWGVFENKTKIVSKMNLDFISNYIFKKDLFKNLIWFDKSNCEDGPLVIQIADKISKLCVCKSVSYHWNRIDSNVSERKDSLEWFLNCFHSALYRHKVASKYNTGKSLDDICRCYVPLIKPFIKNADKKPSTETKRVIRYINSLDLYFDWLFEEIQNEIDVCLCAIAKNENLYIREWVEHYQKLGIKKIFLYDNNEKDGEHFDDVILDYIESGFVTVFDVRGVEKGCVYDDNGINLQTQCYLQCYERHATEFDWICFFDVDEFLEFKENLTLQDFLSKPFIKDINTVLVSWEHYDDNNQIEYEDKKVTERFTHKSNIERHGIKSIVRTNQKIENPCLRNMIHFFTLSPCKYVYASGSNFKFKSKISNPLKRWWLVPQEEHDKALCVLKHYKTKSLEEYIKRHLGRHWGTSQRFTIHQRNIKDLIIDFFKYNEYSEEKMKRFLNLIPDPEEHD